MALHPLRGPGMRPKFVEFWGAGRGHSSSGTMEVGTVEVSWIDCPLPAQRPWGRGQKGCFGTRGLGSGLCAKVVARVTVPSPTVLRPHCLAHQSHLANICPLPSRASASSPAKRTWCLYPPPGLLEASSEVRCINVPSTAWPCQEDK